MSCLWMCLSLLYAASFPQSTLQKGVSLKCNQTVVAEAGETVTLNCTIYNELTEDCDLVNYSWNNAHGGLDSNSTYTCKSDNRTYVSLTIWNVSKEETYSVFIITNCGGDSSSIKVLPDNVRSATKPKPGTEEPSKILVTTAILSVFIPMVVFGILCMVGTKRCKNIIRTIKTGKSHRPLTPEYSTSSEIFV